MIVPSPTSGPHSSVFIVPKDIHTGKYYEYLLRSTIVKHSDVLLGTHKLPVGIHSVLSMDSTMPTSKY